MLEYIVRPFQAPDSHGRTIIHSTPKETTETAILTWGGEADLPDVIFYEQGFNTRKRREDYKEQNRDAETVRIEGTSDDSGNVYVDVKRANKVYFDKEESGSKSSYVGQAGQTYSVNPGLAEQVVHLSITNAADPEKLKATMTLSQNTAAA